MVKSKKKKKQLKKKAYRRDYRWGPGGNMPPWMGGPCPDVMWGPGGNIPPWMGGRCPDDMWGPVGDMSPWTRDPCPDDTWQPRKRKRRKYTQPNITDPCPIMGDPSETMSSGPNAPDQRQCRTFGGPRKSSSGKKQPMDQYGTNSWENGPLPPGNCSSDQTASGNATGNASDIQRYYTEEGAARILSNFGLSTKDLEEFGHYSDEQLKPENMAMILRDIVERKKARQLPTSSQGKEEETSGGHGGSDSLMKTGPLVPSAAQPATTPAASVLPQSSVSPSLSMMNDYHAVSPTVLPHLCTLCQIECANMTEWNLHVGTTAHSEKCDQLRQQHEGDKKEKHIPMPCSTTSNPNASQHSVPGHALSQTWSQSEKPRCRSRASKRPCSPSLSSQMPSSQKRKLGTSTTSPASSAEAGSSEHPLQTNPGHQELATMEAATQEQGDRQREDLLRLALRPLAEQSVMQALSLLQSGSAVGAGLTQGTSLTPLPPVQIDPASLSLVSLMQLVATQVVQTVLASQEVSCVQGSPGVAGPSPQLCIPAGREEKKQESSQRVVPGVAPSCSACVERPGASGSKGDLTPSTLSTVPWLQKKDARPPKQNLPAEIPAGGLVGGKHVRVLIAGHSIVLGASHRAKHSSLGTDLGLSQMAFVQWLGRKNLKWSQLLPTIFQDKAVQQKPDMVVLHAGGNDLGLLKYNQLLKKVIEDLEAIRQRWPGVVILWSYILPRRAWSGIPIMKLLCKVRKKINRQMRIALFATGDGTIPHPQIHPARSELYGKDGISLSAAGNDVFLSNLHTEIKAHILRRWGKKD